MIPKPLYPVNLLAHHGKLRKVGRLRLLRRQRLRERVNLRPEETGQRRRRRRDLRTAPAEEGKRAKLVLVQRRVGLKTWIGRSIGLQALISTG